MHVPVVMSLILVSCQIIDLSYYSKYRIATANARNTTIDYDRILQCSFILFQRIHANTTQMPSGLSYSLLTKSQRQVRKV